MRREQSDRYRYTLQEDEPPYLPTSFVGRKREIEYGLNIILDKDKREASCGGEEESARFLLIKGPRGTGKTWYTYELSRILENSKTPVIGIDLDRYSGKNPAWSVTDIMFNIGYSTGATDEEIRGVDMGAIYLNLFTHLRRFLESSGKLVVVVDHLYPPNWHLFPLLEDYVLELLATLPETRIVLVVGARPYCFRTPELLKRSTSLQLQPFSEASFTEEQLRRQVGKTALDSQLIHNFTGGNPLANYLLGRALKKGDLAVALNETVEGMLSRVPCDQRQQVREIMEALCVLRSFCDSSIPMMLAAYHDNLSYSSCSWTAVRSICITLVESNVAYWEPSLRRYVLDPSIRMVLEHYLKEASPELWRILHNAALCLYNNWAKKYPQTREIWKQEAQYHENKLNL